MIKNFDDIDDVILVYENYIVSELDGEGNIYVEDPISLMIKPNEYYKEDFYVYEFTDIPFYTLTEYVQLIKKFKKDSESYKTTFAFSLYDDNIWNGYLQYDEDLDDPDFFSRYYNTITLFKLKDVTAKRINDFWKET